MARNDVGSQLETSSLVALKTPPKNRSHGYVLVLVDTYQEPAYRGTDCAAEELIIPCVIIPPPWRIFTIFHARAGNSVPGDRYPAACIHIPTSVRTFSPRICPGVPARGRNNPELDHRK